MENLISTASVTSDLTNKTINRLRVIETRPNRPTVIISRFERETQCELMVCVWDKMKFTV